MRPAFLFQFCRVRRLDADALLADPALAALDPDLDFLLNLNEPSDYEAARALPAPEVIVRVFGALRRYSTVSVIWLSCPPRRSARPPPRAGSASEGRWRPPSTGSGSRATRRHRSSRATACRSVPRTPATERLSVLRPRAAACPRRSPASAGSHSHTAQAWRNAERANSSAAACGSAAARRRPSRGRTRRASPSQRAAAGESVARREALRRRVRVGVERGLAVARVAGPPADGDLLRVHRVAHDEVVRRRVGRRAGEEADREVERAPPGVDRRRAPAVGRAERGEHERGAGRRGEVGRDLAGVVGRVLVVLVERHGPRHLLRRRVDLDRAAEARGPPPARSRVTSPTGRSGVSATRSRAPVAVLDDRLVRVQVERDDERPRAVGRRQRQRLPAARGQAQRGVLELRLGRRERHRELAEHLRVRVQRVAGRAPRLVGEGAATRRAWTPRYLARVLGREGRVIVTSWSTC